MERHPFIAINECNITKVSSRSLARFLNWVGKSAKTKKQFLAKYFDYSFCCSKERWLRFVQDICESNCLVFEADRLSREYDSWIAKGCSYSIYFF